MATYSNADQDIQRMTSTNLKLVSSSSNGSEEVYTMLAIDGIKVLMTIICKVTQKFYIEAYNADGAELFTAESEKHFGSRTEINYLKSCIGLIHSSSTSLSGMVTLEAEPPVTNIYAIGPHSIALGIHNKEHCHRFFKHSTEISVMVARASQSELKSIFTLICPNPLLTFNEKKLLVVAAVQICFSDYFMQKLLTPDAVISIPIALCLNCGDSNALSYFSRELNISGDNPFQDCFVLRVAGTNRTLRKQYYDAIEVKSKRRAFTVECSLDEYYESDGKASITDITGKKIYGIKYINGEDHYPMAVYAQQKNLVGSYSKNSNSFYDGESELLFTVEEKQISPAYSERWGESTQHFIEPDIALVTRHHCAVGVCFKNDKVDELAKILVIAFALRANFNTYTFGMLDIPDIKYIYNETNVCEICKV